MLSCLPVKAVREVSEGNRVEASAPSWPLIRAESVCWLPTAALQHSSKLGSLFKTFIHRTVQSFTYLPRPLLLPLRISPHDFPAASKQLLAAPNPPLRIPWPRATP